MKVAYFTPRAVNPDWYHQFCQYLPEVEFVPYCDSTVDFIYCASASASINALQIAKRFDKPCIIWAWDYPDPKIFPGREAQCTQLIATLQQASLVLTASKYTQAVFEKYGIKSKQLYFYADVPLIESVPNVDKNTPGEIDYVTQVSRITKHKQFEVTIQAMKGLGIPLYLHGPTVGTNESYLSYLYNWAEECKVDLRVRQGRTHWNVISNIKRARVLVSPTQFEGWGLTPVEAAFCGTPIILSDLPVFREQYGDSIPYHKVGDVAKLRDQLKKLLSNKDEAARVVSVIQEKTKTFTPQEFAKRWLEAVT